MKKADAQKLIQELQNEVNRDNVKKQFWMDKVQGYVQFIFGDSTQSIALPMFGTYYWDRPYTDWNDTKADDVVQKLKDLFSTYQSMISKGVFFRKNIASDYSTPEIIIAVLAIVIALLTTIGSGLYGIGYAIGQSCVECKTLNCENEKNRLADSLNLMKQEVVILKHAQFSDNSKKQSKSLNP